MLYQSPQEIIIAEAQLHYLIFVRDDKKSKYVIQGIFGNIRDSETAVRIGLFADLIDVYGYSMNRIVFDSPIPDSVSHQSIDMLVYSDDEQKIPFIAIKCSKTISDEQLYKELNQIIAYARILRASYAVHADGEKRIIIAMQRLRIVAKRDPVYGKNSIKKAIVTDIPQSHEYT